MSWKMNGDAHVQASATTEIAAARALTVASRLSSGAPASATIGMAM